MKYVITSREWNNTKDALDAGYTKVACTPADIVVAVTSKIKNPKKEYILYEHEHIEIADIEGQSTEMKEKLNWNGKQ